jgi:hypothetical protein
MYDMVAAVVLLDDDDDDDDDGDDDDVDAPAPIGQALPSARRRR